jgi:transposase
VLTDGRGVTLGLIIAPANRHDIKLAMPTLDSMPVHRPQPGPWHPQHFCGDKGYDDGTFRKRLKRRHYRVHIKSRGEEIEEHKRHPHAKAHRWVNERTQSWYNRFRRVLIRWEKKAENYQAILEFVAGWTAFRVAGVLG